MQFQGRTPKGLIGKKKIEGQWVRHGRGECREG